MQHLSPGDMSHLVDYGCTQAGTSSCPLPSVERGPRFVFVKEAFPQVEAGEAHLIKVAVKQCSGLCDF